MTRLAADVPRRAWYGEGKCGTCDKTCALLKDGTLRWHCMPSTNRGRAQECPGRGSKPVATAGATSIVIELTSGLTLADRTQAVSRALHDVWVETRTRRDASNGADRDYYRERAARLAAAYSQLDGLVTPRSADAEPALPVTPGTRWRDADDDLWMLGLDGAMWRLDELAHPESPADLAGAFGPLTEERL